MEHKKARKLHFVLNVELQGNSEKAYEVQVTVSGKNNSIKFSEKTNISEEDSLITSIRGTVHRNKNSIHRHQFKL